MITSLDHLVLVCEDIEAGQSDYTALLGQSANWVSTDNESGVRTVLFQLENMALELMGAIGEGPGATKLEALCKEKGEGLKSIAFSSDDLSSDHTLFKRRGLAPGEISEGVSQDDDTRAERKWRRFRIDDDASKSAKLFVLGDHDGETLTSTPVSGSVKALDHVVVSTPNPDRAAALYGARLGLHLSLDRENKDWDTRFLFFKTGGVVFEVINRLSSEQAPSEPDSIWGVTWRVADLETAHSRLSGDGFEVSEIRTGRKPGTRVFTVRNRTCNTPTLFLEQTPRG